MAAPAAPIAPSAARRRRSSGRRLDRDRVLQVLAVVATAIPFLLLARAALFHDGPFSHFGDVGAAEVAVQNAAALDQTLGPYSRFGWNHPGPALFYLLAVPYGLMGWRGEALVVGTVAINAVASMGVVALLARRAGARAALGAAGATAAFGVVVLPSSLANPWSPMVLVMPAALFVVLCADLAAGGRWSLVGAVGVGSYLVQTHVGLSGVVALALVAAVGTAARGRWRRVRWLPPSGPALVRAGAAAAVGVVMWAPPVWQELQGRPGNLTALARFFARGEGGHSIGEALSGLGAGMLVRPARRHLSADVGLLGGPAWGAVALCVAIAAITFLAWRRQHRLATALGALSLTVAFAAVVSLLRVEGSIHGYMVLWLGACTLAGALAGVVAATAGPDRATGPGGATAATGGAAHLRSTAALAGLAVAAIAWSSYDALRFDPGTGFSNVAAATTATAGLLQPGDDHVLVCISSAAAWPVGAGVVADLRRNGIDVRVQKVWVHTFGQHLAADGTEPVLLELDVPAAEPRPVPVQAAERSAATSELRIRSFRASGGGAIDESACPELH